MVRRNGWVACVIGLQVCVLSGCLHTDARPANATGPVVPPMTGAGGTPAPHSPYAMRSTDLPVEDRKPLELPKPAVDPEVKRTSQPDIDKAPTPPATAVAKPPQPLPIAPAPAPNWLTTESVATPPAKELPESPLVTALRFVLGKKPSEAFDALKGYDKQTQEILLALLPAAARLSEGGLDRAPPEEIAAVVEQLDHLTNLLRGRTGLTVEKACFARRIEGFGVYDALPANPIFIAGADGQHGDRAQVYAEVHNVLSKFDGKVHAMQLAGRLEVYGGDGQCLWGRNFRDGPTCSLSPRQDVYVGFRFSPPPNLRPGDYLLVVEVRDESVPTPDAPQRVARCKLPFRVGEPAVPRAGDK